MTNITILNKSHISECIKLINFDIEDKIYFENHGWTKKELFNQFEKKINFTIGYFDNNKLVAFIIGDLIFIEKISEYEILFIYVKNDYRKKGIADQLLKYLYRTKELGNLKKIFLEVACNNSFAIKLYEKNGFSKINKRKNYYLIDGKKIDALCYIKQV